MDRGSIWVKRDADGRWRWYVWYVWYVWY